MDKWKKLNSSQKHMALMYLYRTRTDLEDIELYIATFRFRKLKLTLSDIPQKILEMSDDLIRKMAYAETGAKLP